MHSTTISARPRAQRARPHAHRRLLVGASATGLGLALAVSAAPLTASAHVTATASSTSAGGYTIVTISVPHGCDDAATEVVRIEIPESIESVTPTVNPNWSIETVSTDDGRTSEVIYTAVDEPLPSHHRDVFELSLRLPDGEAGDTLLFPTTQECEGGATAAWVDENQDSDYPSPMIELTAATGDAHGGHSGGDAQDGADDGSGSAADGGSDETPTAAATEPAADWIARVLGVGGLVVGLAGLAFGLAARRKATS